MEVGAPPACSAWDPSDPTNLAVVSRGANETYLMRNDEPGRGRFRRGYTRRYLCCWSHVWGWGGYVHEINGIMHYESKPLFLLYVFCASASSTIFTNCWLGLCLLQIFVFNGSRIIQPSRLSPNVIFLARSDATPPHYPNVNTNSTTISKVLRRILASHVHEVEPIRTWRFGVGVDGWARFFLGDFFFCGERRRERREDQARVSQRRWWLCRRPPVKQKIQ